jgi:hypothetical protein
MNKYNQKGDLMPVTRLQNHYMDLSNKCGKAERGKQHLERLAKTAEEVREHRKPLLLQKDIVDLPQWQATLQETPAICWF